MDVEIKRVLLNLLSEDVEVINTLKRIIIPEEINFENDENREIVLLQQNRKLKTEINSITRHKKLLEDELHKQKEELERMEHDLNQKDDDIKTIQSKYLECQKIKEETIKKYHDFKLKYSELDVVYNKYLGLGEPIIKRMERILNPSSDHTETPEIFMAYGTQENNIVALWESIATNFDFYDLQDKTEDLIDIFQYFLNLYKEITFKNIQIDWPNIGDLYDERKHTRTSSSSVAGKIQNVILPGFSIGKSVTKKSLVIVK